MAGEREEALLLLPRRRAPRPGSIVITSPASCLITYSLLDACRLLVAHEQRHPSRPPG